MRFSQGFFAVLSALVFLTVGSILYYILSRLFRTEDKTRVGEELLAYAAIVSVVIATIKIFLTISYVYINGDKKTYGTIISILTALGIISVPILIGVGYSNLKESPDWKYNQAAEKLILIALGLSFLPIAIFIVNFIWTRTTNDKNEEDASIFATIKP